MTNATPHQIGSAGFVQLTRLFAGMKRSGRVIDVIWFQQNAEYARAMLALAGENDNEEVRDIALKLRSLMRDFLEPPAPVVTTAPSATGTGKVPAIDTETGAPADRYVRSLR